MKGFDRIGVADHLSLSSGNLILFADRKVKIGEPVHSQSRQKIGRVFDFFGPVSKPMIAVRIDGEDYESHLGRPLFVKASRR